MDLQGAIKDGAEHTDTSRGIQRPSYAARVVAIVGVLTVVGFFLRVYQLEEQSFWLDEFLNVWNLGAPTLSTYLDLFRIKTTEQGAAFFYYALQYFWAHWVGMNPVPLRLFPVILGTALIPLSYTLGEVLGGKRTGFIVAMCVALSPQHVWFSQEPRPYVLLTLEVVIGAYAFWQIWHSGKRWWWFVNIGTNILVLWTFLFGILFLFVQGLFLLSRIRQDFRSVLFWVMIHACVLIFWLTFVVGIPVQNNPFGDTTVQGIVNELFFDDIIGLNPDLLPPWKTNPGSALTGQAGILLRLRPFFDGAFRMVIAGGFLWFSISSVYRLFLAQSGRHRQGAGTLESRLFIVLLAVVPSIVLGVCTMFLKRSFMGCMYTLYGTLGLYLCLGCVLASLRNRWHFRIAAVSIALLYIYQLLVFVPFVTRTDWRSVARYISETGNPDDLVIEVSLYEPRRYTEYYLPKDGPQVRCYPTFEGGVSESVKALYGESGSAPSRARVWLVFESYIVDFLNPSYDFAGTLEKSFRARGITGRYRVFPGHYNPVVYCLERSDTGIRQMDPAPIPTPWNLDYRAVSADLGYTDQLPDVQNKAITELRQCLGFWPPLSDFFGLVSGLYAIELGDPALAHRIINGVERRGYKECFVPFYRGFAYAAEGQREKALASFEQSFQMYAPLRRIFGEFVRLLLEQNDLDGARKEILRLRSYGQTLYPEPMEMAVRGIAAINGA